jgi:hypothetical protein
MLTMARALTPRSASCGTKSSRIRAMTTRAYRKVATKMPSAAFVTGSLRLSFRARGVTWALANWTAIRRAEKTIPTKVTMASTTPAVSAVAPTALKPSSVHPPHSSSRHAIAAATRLARVLTTGTGQREVRNCSRTRNCDLQITAQPFLAPWREVRNRPKSLGRTWPGQHCQDARRTQKARPSQSADYEHRGSSDQ